MTRVAILWQAFPHYVSKCVETLARQKDIQILIYFGSKGAFPNVLEPLRSYPNVCVVDNGTQDSVLNECKDFNPQVALIPLTRRVLTRRGVFVRIASAWRENGTLVIGTCDNFWKGSWRDYSNLMVSKLGAFSHYDAILVPGSLGKMYAKKIGFSPQTIVDGLYTCDTDTFRPVGLRRHTEQATTDWPRVFLFVGQYIKRKGLSILLEAYQKYRQQASMPWELWLVGKGEMEKNIDNIEGVKNLGQKTPLEIADLMQQAGCFVMPSLEDHWGVVIHEALNAGLPILASSGCGASVELVQSGFNGYVFPVNDVVTLSRLLLFMGESGFGPEMGRNSMHMASRFSLELWKRRILLDIPIFLNREPLLIEQV